MDPLMLSIKCPVQMTEVLWSQFSKDWFQRLFFTGLSSGILWLYVTNKSNGPNTCVWPHPFHLLPLPTGMICLSVLSIALYVPMALLTVDSCCQTYLEPEVRLFALMHWWWLGPADVYRISIFCMNFNWFKHQHLPNTVNSGPQQLHFLFCLLHTMM